MNRKHVRRTQNHAHICTNKPKYNSVNSVPWLTVNWPTFNHWYRIEAHRQRRRHTSSRLRVNDKFFFFLVRPLSTYFAHSFSALTRDKHKQCYWEVEEVTIKIARQTLSKCRHFQDNTAIQINLRRCSDLSSISLMWHSFIMSICSVCLLDFDDLVQCNRPIAMLRKYPKNFIRVQVDVSVFRREISSPSFHSFHFFVQSIHEKCKMQCQSIQA